MKRKLLLLYLLICSSAVDNLLAQEVLEGVILETGGKPLSYARVGIDLSSVATLSDEAGAFALTIPESYKGARLTVQVPGYRTISFPVDSLMSLDQIHLVLKEDIRLLEEVTVNRKRYRPKRRVIGNKSLPPFSRASYGNHWTLVTLIETDEMLQVMNVRIHIGETRRDSVTLRPVLYASDSLTQSPGKELTKANEFIKVKVKKGWLDFDLSAQQLYLDKPFFIGFEILSVSDGNGDISVSASLGGKNKYFMWERPSFTSVWRKASNTYMIKAHIEY